MGGQAGRWVGGWMDGNEIRFREMMILRMKKQGPDEGVCHSLSHHPGFVLSWLMAFLPFNSQERQEFKTTCLVDEEEMKKLLRERGHMLENHVERLWAYLTIQELLAKR